MNWDNPDDPVVRRLEFIKHSPNENAAWTYETAREFDWSRQGVLDWFLCYDQGGYDGAGGELHRRWMEALERYDPFTYEFRESPKSLALKQWWKANREEIVERRRKTGEPFNFPDFSEKEEPTGIFSIGKNAHREIAGLLDRPKRGVEPETGCQPSARLLSFPSAKDSEEDEDDWQPDIPA